MAQLLDFHCFGHSYFSPTLTCNSTIHIEFFTTPLLLLVYYSTSFQTRTLLPRGLSFCYHNIAVYFVNPCKYFSNVFKVEHETNRNRKKSTLTFNLLSIYSTASVTVKTFHKPSQAIMIYLKLRKV